MPNRGNQLQQKEKNKNPHCHLECGACGWTWNRRLCDKLGHRRKHSLLRHFVKNKSSNAKIPIENDSVFEAGKWSVTIFVAGVDFPAAEVPIE